MTINNKGDGVDENFKSDFLSDAEQAQQKLPLQRPGCPVDPCGEA